MTRSLSFPFRLATLFVLIGMQFATAGQAPKPTISGTGGLLDLPISSGGGPGAPATFTLTGINFPAGGGTITVGKNHLAPSPDPIDISFDGKNYFSEGTGGSYTFTGSSFSVVVYIRTNSTVSSGFGSTGPIFSGPDGSGYNQAIEGIISNTPPPPKTSAPSAASPVVTTTSSTPKKVTPPPTVVVVNGAAISSAINGLNTGVLNGLAGMGGARTVLFDVNGHLFNLRSGFDRGENGFLADAGQAPWEQDQGDGKEVESSKELRFQAPQRRWRVYATENFGSQSLSPIEQQAGIRAESWATSAGVERMVDHGLIFGFATSLLSNEQHYTSGLGNLKMDGPALTGYLSYAPQNSGLWADLLYNWGHYDTDVNRNPGFGFSTAHGSTHFTTNAVQFNTGWNIPLDNGKMTTGPTLGVDYMHGNLAGYSETGGGLGALNFSSQQLDSLVTNIGWQLSREFETRFGTVIPQLRLGWERENLGEESVAVALQNSPYYLVQGNNVVAHLNRPFQASLDLKQPGRSYAVAGAGVKMNLKSGWNIALDYEAQVFRTGYTQSLAAVRVGFAF